MLATVSSFYQWAIVAELFDGENPMRRRPDAALAMVAERHRPFTGGASRQQPTSREVRVRLPLRLPRISDPEIRRQYEAALAGGARIAGPAADALLQGRLDEESLHWLQTNFLKTELELGHCLRLPAEGPCECDLALTCPKFLTTSDYAPRLRARINREDELISDAERHGWAREVERHQSIQRRLRQLLQNLHEDEPLTNTGIGDATISSRLMTTTPVEG